MIEPPAPVVALAERRLSCQVDRAALADPGKGPPASVVSDVSRGLTTTFSFAPLQPFWVAPLLASPP